MEGIIVVYKNKKVLHYLQEKIAEVSHLITNTDKLEASIYKQLASYLNTGKCSYSRIRLIINREIGTALKRYRKEESSLFCLLGSKDDFGESAEFEPQDILANVEDAVLEKSSLNEKITGLASDDRERFTLNAWSTGEGDLAIAKTLASLYGGTPETHRSFVKRFRVKCQRKLAA